jgi:hypothetical protein
LDSKAGIIKPFSGVARVLKVEHLDLPVVEIKHPGASAVALANSAEVLDIYNKTH